MCCIPRQLWTKSPFEVFWQQQKGGHERVLRKFPPPFRRRTKVPLSVPKAQLIVQPRSLRGCIESASSNVFRLVFSYFCLIIIYSQPSSLGYLKSRQLSSEIHSHSFVSCCSDLGYCNSSSRNSREFSFLVCTSSLLYCRPKAT